MPRVCPVSRCLREHVSDQPNYVRGDLVRGEIARAILVPTLSAGLFSDYRNVGLFNDAPETEHSPSVWLISLAIKARAG